MVYKNNFWNQLRKDRGMTFSALGKILNCSTTAVRYYFMGYRMPSLELVEKLCEGFNVDLEKGMQEFRDMYKAYKAGHKSTNASDGRGKHTAGKANAFKADPNNFWKCKLQASGKTFKDVVKDTGLGYSSVQTYFRGFAMPSDTAIKTLCDYFSVDFDTGRTEFENIYKAWGENNPDFIAYGNTYRRKSGESKSVSRSTEVAKLTEPATSDIELSSIKAECSNASYVVYTITEQADEILKQLYNKLSYAEFKNVAKQLSKVTAYSGSAKNTNLLESIYNVVDCPTFLHIVRVLDQEVEF